MERQDRLPRSAQPRLRAKHLVLLWKLKGDEYLQRLAQQELLISQNLRQLADSPAKGKLAFTIGLSHYRYDPFLKAGLPVKPVPKIKEGAHANNGSGVIAVVENPPHPNAAKFSSTACSAKKVRKFTAKR